MKKATRYEDQLIQFCNSYREKIRKIKEERLTTARRMKAEGLNLSLIHI